ncbi:MAG: hypothetical protein WC812_02030 [Candidatus Pacearchaeota archaeon]
MPPQFKPLQSSFASLGLGTEVMYSFIIILLCLIIYFGTRELYNLSEHRGIKYFRFSFLFFAIALFFRSIIKFLLIFFNNQAIVFEFTEKGFVTATALLFMYFSSLALFYLAYSLVWDKWKSKLNREYFAHISALLIAVITLLTNNVWVYIILNLLILIVGGILIYITRKKRFGKINNFLYMIYFLLSAFWVLNMVDILVPSVFQPFQLLIYLLSILVFSLILYKVLRKAGIN